jgi:hypothetical protein
MKIADEILRQLGGRRFMVMTGSKAIAETDGKTLTLHLTKNKTGANRLRITLRSDDTYDMTYSSERFVRATGELKTKVKKEHNGVYVDQLVELFEKDTGLYTKL